ncbi:MAG: TraR/DksA family transcriptional regulator [Gammaproteobacteria bacterium]|nr:TraR/DksA family transcriptional regulator [Gammaproteobacteria bacterium]
MKEVDWKLLIEARLADLIESSAASHADRAPVVLDQTVQGRLSRIDAMQGQAMAQATEVRRRQQIGALRASLARLERGEFGDCVECGEAIAPRRLRADPAVTLCIACAEAGEGDA